MERQDAREQLKSYLRNYVESVTQKSRGANLYVCPLCGSGKGKNGTGAFSIKDGTRWKCFSCEVGGDIFDLYGAINGTTDHNEQLKGLSEMYGVQIAGCRSTAQEDFSPEYQNHAQNEQSTYNSAHTPAYTQTDPTQQTDYRDFFLQAHSHIKETDYPQKRGLSEETIRRFQLGYVAEWRHPKAPPKAPASPRLIIPTSTGSYLARDTREQIPEKQMPYSKSKVGSIQIFNCEALKKATSPIFVVEGELDALSIIDVGGEAVALGSTSKAKPFIDICKAAKPSQPLIVALDNDKAGEDAAKKLIEGLQELDIPCYRRNPAGEYKDANEALQHNRDALRIAVSEAVSEAEHIQDIQDEETQARREAYLKNSTAHYLQSFINGIADSVNTPCISTGFSQLDAALDGGLYEGLYIVGAISSLGKTTFATQIADQIAQAGHDVLIFSLEMARAEIMAKSISRHTLQSVLATGGDIKNAKTARGITTGKRYEEYSQTEMDLIKSSIMEYGKYAQNIYISEGVGDVGAEQIRETVKKHILFTGKTPVVIIDYLQILAPYNERATDKQNTDKAVLELRRIARDYKTPVIGISSFNRANYKEAVGMEAFKESGAIEYSSDVLIGLQLKGTGEQGFHVNDAKQKNPRDIELMLLKGRNGPMGDKISFKYYPQYNYFEET